MPKSKRNRVVPTSKTRKDRKELTRRLHANIQDAASQYRYILVFSVTNMRNTFLKTVRSDLSDCRIFMGKTKLMAHALGTSAETEHLPGSSGISPYLKGEVGLLCTDRPAKEIEEHFARYVEMDYARAGTVAADTFVIPRGVMLTTRYGVEAGEDDPLPMAIEPRLRSLGVPTKIVKGRVILEEIADQDENVMDDDDEGGYVVCREGDALDSRQTELLKIFGKRMAEFKVGLLACYDKESGSVRGMEEMEVDETTA